MLAEYAVLHIYYLVCDPCLPLLQIILALGNYMNSSKRGAVYGFKLQSLDLVSWFLRRLKLHSLFFS